MLRIKLRYDDVEVMVQRFAANVGKSGLFLPTKSLQPVGAEVKFELRLADETPVLVGLGRVKAATAPDPAKPKATFGMAIELMRVTPQSRALILRMLERRKVLGLPETQLPMAADIDAARQAGVVEGVRDFASGPVVTAVATPVVTAVATPVVTTIATPAALRPALTPAAAPAPIPAPVSLPAVPAPPGEGLMTAPRRTTGPMSVAKVLTIAPLGPEPARKKRLAISEIMETASGPIALATAGLDDDVDVGAALVRARALVGGALDAELEALAEAAAVPVEVSIEGASAALARQLGGLAVRRDRSARWAPPPATTIASPPPPAEAAPIPAPSEAAPASAAVEAVSASFGTGGAAAADTTPFESAIAAVVARDELEPAAMSGDAVPAEATPEDGDPAPAEGDPAPAEAMPVEPIHAHAAPDPSAPIDPSAAINAIAEAEAEARAEAEDEQDAIAAINAIADVELEPDEPPVVAPALLADVIHQLDDFDLEDVEHTEAGAIPEPAFGLPGPRGEAPDVAQRLLAERLEAELASAEAEAEADDLGLGAHEAPEADDGELAFGEPDDHPGHGQVALVADDAEPPVDLSLEEIDEFEILAEADAGDEDLLPSEDPDELDPGPTGIGRGRAQPDDELDPGPTGIGRGRVQPDDELDPGPTRIGRASVLDFAARLDLGDESDAGLSLPAELSTHHVLSDDLADALDDGDDDGAHGLRMPDAHLDSAGQALAAFETGDEPLDDEPAHDPDEHHDRFARGRIVQPIFEPEPSSSYTLALIPSDDFELPARPAPRPAARPSKLPALHESPVEDHELEHALEALDVDLDDLSIPHAATQLQRDDKPTAAIRPSALRRSDLATGASEHDLDVEIDFEDDD